MGRILGQEEEEEKKKNHKRDEGKIILSGLTKRLRTRTFGRSRKKGSSEENKRVVQCMAYTLSGAMFMVFVILYTSWTASKVAMISSLTFARFPMLHRGSGSGESLWHDSTAGVVEDGVVDDEWIASSSGGGERADGLADALDHWTGGAMSDEVRRTAAGCTPRDVADAVLRGRKLGVGGVVDIGASNGYPVSTLALDRAVTWLVSVEPTNVTFERLARLHVRDDRTAFFAVRGAASSIDGRVQMQFHRERTDISCINCLPKVSTNNDVTTSDVTAWTIDTLLLHNNSSSPLSSSSFSSSIVSSAAVNISDIDDTSPILLLKIHAQGHELEVLRGAKHLLATTRVQNLLVEFHPKLLGDHSNALAVLQLILDAGMHCTHLTFATDLPKYTKHRKVTTLRFGRAITQTSLKVFLHFVLSTAKYTDLFCSHRSQTRPRNSPP